MTRTSRLSIKEAKVLTGEKNHYIAFDMLYKRLIKRTWRMQGKVYSPAGMTWHSCDGPQSFHLTITESLEGGGVYHSRVKLDLSEALDCISGNFEHVSRVF